jgi:hypothetical protein
MLTSKNNPLNPLEKLQEPRQLDLFGLPSSPESVAAGDPICPTVCDQLATQFSEFYKLDADHAAALEQYLHTIDVSGLVLQSASADLSIVIGYWQHAIEASTVVGDYVRGIASTMNFFPVPTEQTFVRSDLIAMASDWTKVQSDLNGIWGAMTAAERLCRERSGKQEKRRHTAHTE